MDHTHTTTTTTTHRHVPHVNSGWGVIAAVIILAVAINAWSYWVHKTTYRPFVHPSSTIPNTQSGGH